MRNCGFIFIIQHDNDAQNFKKYIYQKFEKSLDNKELKENRKFGL